VSDPLTLQFGPWQPDLQNIPVQIPFYPALADPVPAADCLNVYYADGAYRSIPSPASIGPALGFQALNAFSWYDNSTGEEYIFAAGNGQISALINGIWQPLPLGGSFGLTLAQGVITAVIDILRATLVAGSFSSETSGYIAGTTGSLTPSTDANGNIVTQLTLFTQPPPRSNYMILLISPPGLGAAYFHELQIGTQSALASAATYSSSAGGSSWQWSGANALSIVSGDEYTVQIT
jgi:hypothetical protein